MISIKETTDGVVFNIRVLPRSSRCEIAGIQNDALKLKITAPPIEGQANEECIRFLSDALGVKRNRISIIAGRKSKNKSVAVTGLTTKDIESIIPT
ncbi:MAG TPA: YggU family protein [Deltaproteobacteria bacterium]|nr:YggU family protein [Deltaproteobacteria bacterium]